jgi:hypothetical protein
MGSYVRLVINNVEFLALLDTGSCVSIIQLYKV